MHTHMADTHSLASNIASCVHPTMDITQVVVNLIFIKGLPTTPTPMRLTPPYGASHMIASIHLLRSCVAAWTLLCRRLERCSFLLSFLQSTPSRVPRLIPCFCSQLVYQSKGLHGFLLCNASACQHGKHTVLAFPALNLIGCAASTLAFHVLTRLATTTAPSVDPLASLLNRPSEVTNSVDAHAIGGQSTCGRRSTAERAEQGCSVDDGSSLVQSIPAIEATFADLLITAMAAASWH